LGSGRRHGQGPDVEPTLERAAERLVAIQRITPDIARLKNECISPP